MGNSKPASCPKALSRCGARLLRVEISQFNQTKYLVPVWATALKAASKASATGFKEKPRFHLLRIPISR